MKKINWKILNLAFWTEVLLSYVLPFRVMAQGQYRVGFPIPFITIYDKAIGATPLMSMALTPLGATFNGMILYLILSLLHKRMVAHRK